MQSVPIIAKVMILNPNHGKAYSLQHHVIKFVSDLRQVSGFLRVLRFPPPTDCHDKTEILLKVALNTITLTLNLCSCILYTVTTLCHKVYQLFAIELHFLPGIFNLLILVYSTNKIGCND